MKTFAELFAGRTDCFGIYIVSETTNEGKRKGQGITYPNSRHPDRTLEDSDIESHLAGAQMTGIVPVLLDGTCSWFAIDVDDYSLSLQEVVMKVEREQLPLVVCRSKSGGAHLYCFIDGSIKASLAIELGRKWSEILGWPKAEVFPKQANFTDENAKGNWIILPYFGGDDHAVDFGIDIEGNRLKLDDFVRWANAKLITPSEATNYKVQKHLEVKDLNDEQILKESPPCVVQLLNEGVHEGGRNNAVFHMAVYYQKLDELTEKEEWEENTYQFAQTMLTPALKMSETAQVVSHAKPPGKFQYTCDIEPMRSMCDKKECLKRKLGVGHKKQEYGDLEITGIIKIDSRPPIWEVTINGIQVQMDTETLLTPRKFKVAVADNLNKIVGNMTHAAHDEIIRPVMESALTIKPMEGLSGEGKVDTAMRNWVAFMVNRATSIDDLKAGLPYYDDAAGILYIPRREFVKEYMRTHRDNRTEADLSATLTRLGFVSHKRMKLKTTTIYVMSKEIDIDDIWWDMDDGEKF